MKKKKAMTQVSFRLSVQEHGQLQKLTKYLGENTSVSDLMRLAVAHLLKNPSLVIDEKTNPVRDLDDKGNYGTGVHHYKKHPLPQKK